MKAPPANLVGIDIGNHSLKAVRLQRKGNQYALARVATVPTNRSPQDQALPTETAITSQIKEVVNVVKTSGASYHFTTNSPAGAVRYVELPNMPLEDVRAALKLNSATYLRQNFENYTFDACPLDTEASNALTVHKSKNVASSTTHGKIKILVSGISTSEVVLYFHSARAVGVKPLSLQLVPISLLNAFEAAYPDIFVTQPIALLDMGYLSSSLTIVDHGKPLLTRMVQVGGKNMTEYLATKLSIDFSKAEAAKMQQDPNLAEAVARTCVPLVREVRSSINFFEKNSDQAIAKIYLSGGPMRSQAVIEALSNDMGLACEVWNAANNLPIELPPDQRGLFDGSQSLFTAALGLARTYAAGTSVPLKTQARATPTASGEATPPPPAQ
jgi:type IV pilus assembly protein PilM